MAGVYMEKWLVALVIHGRVAMTNIVSAIAAEPGTQAFPVEEGVDEPRLRGKSCCMLGLL
jgi:hypothetical protein